jgi:hypothetical protein
MPSKTVIITELKQNLQTRAYEKVWAIFAITLIFASTFASTELNADGTAATTSNCQGSGGQGQLSQYCNSAQSSSQGSDVDSSLYKVWGGVAAICTTACANPTPTLAGTCKWSNTAGTGTDAIATKNYSSALMGIAQQQVAGQVGKAGTQQVAGVQQATNADGSVATGGKPAPKPPSRMVACMNAATSSMQAVAKYKSAKSANQATAANTASAAQLASNSAGTVGSDPNEKSSGATAGELYEGNSPLSSGATAAAAGSASICATAKATGQAVATIQCAVANDPTLPSYVATPQFLNDFKAATGGTDFSNFGSDPDQSAGDAIAQAASGGLGNGTATQVAAVMKSMDNSEAPYQVAAYGSTSGSDGGAPVAAAPSAEESDMTKVAEALLEQMKAGQPGQNAEQTAATGIQAVVFANQNRAPASIPEDKTLSIFDRVTYRYFLVTGQKRVDNSK